MKEERVVALCRFFRNERIGQQEHLERLPLRVDESPGPYQRLRSIKEYAGYLERIV